MVLIPEKVRGFLQGRNQPTEIITPSEVRKPKLVQAWIFMCSGCVDPNYKLDPRFITGSWPFEENKEATRKAFIFDNGYVVEVDKQQDPAEENFILEADGTYRNIYIITQASKKDLRQTREGKLSILKSIGEAHTQKFHNGEVQTITGLLGFSWEDGKEMLEMDSTIISVSAVGKPTKFTYRRWPSGSRFG